jgi:hypothetical protein
MKLKKIRSGAKKNISVSFLDFSVVLPIQRTKMLQFRLILAIFGV